MSKRTSSRKRIDVMLGRRSFIAANGAVRASVMTPVGIMTLEKGEYRPSEHPVVASCLNSCGGLSTTTYSLHISFPDKQSLRRIVFNGVMWSNSNKNRGKRLFRKLDTDGNDYGPAMRVALSWSQSIERAYTIDENGNRVRVPESGQIAVTLSGMHAAEFVERCKQHDYNNFIASQQSDMKRWGTRPAENYKTPFSVTQTVNPCTSNGDLRTYKTPIRQRERWDRRDTVE